MSDLNHKELSSKILKSVDVIIPAFNAERFINRALDSVLEQTHTPRKIIVVNDGSYDNTEEKISEVKENSPIPIVLINQVNKGPNAARNAGLEYSSSDFVAFLDADDFWEREKIEKQLKVFLENDERLGVVYVEHKLFDEYGSLIKSQVDFPLYRGDVYKILLKRNIVIGSCSSVLIRKTCFDKAGIFDESLSGSEDWDMWLRLSKFYDFDYIDEQLVFITDRKLSNNKDLERMLANRIKFTNKWINDIAKFPELINFHRSKILSLAIKCKFDNLNFNISESICNSITEKTKRELFNDKGINMMKYFPEIVFNFFKEKFLDNS